MSSRLHTGFGARRTSYSVTTQGVNWAWIAQSVLRLAVVWTVRGSYLGGGQDFSHPSRPALWPTQSPINGYRVIPGGKAAGA